MFEFEPENLYQRLFTARYGSMLSPGVGTLTLTAPPNPRRNSAESPLAAPTRAPCRSRLIDSGIRLPPITRNDALPPNDVKLSDAPFGFQLATPAVRLMLASPNVPRAPNAVPLPR